MPRENKGAKRLFYPTIVAPLDFFQRRIEIFDGHYRALRPAFEFCIVTQYIIGSNLFELTTEVEEIEPKKYIVHFIPLYDEGDLKKILYDILSGKSFSIVAIPNV